MIGDFSFLVFMAMAASGAVMMVSSRSPVASLMYLVMSLFAIAGLFVMLDAHFLAAVQVIVYAGAIMVLFLFVIMLLNLGHDAGPDLRGLVARATALLLGSGVFAAVVTALRAGTRPEGGAGRVEASQALLAERGAIQVVAEPLFRDYVVPFEVTSLLLLVAVVGAIVLARRRA